MSKNLIQFDLRSLLAATLQEGCTQSEITTMDNCGMLWFWRYGMLLRKKGQFSWATTYGSGAHQAWEEMYSTKGKRWSAPDLREQLRGKVLTQAQEKELYYWQGVLNVQTECYAQFYKDDFDMFNVEKAEIIVDITIDWQGTKIRLKGMIDLKFAMLQRDGLWMMDHKTTGRMDLQTVQGWDFRFQFMFYLWLMTRYEEQEGRVSKFRGYYINAMKKPTIRVKQNESTEAYFERLRNEMLMEPAKYYYRQPLLLDRGAIEHFEQHVLAPKLHRISLLTSTEVPDSIKLSIVNNMNTDHCQRYGVCEFLPLCAHGWELEGFQYEKRPTKHEELEGEAEE